MAEFEFNIPELFNGAFGVNVGYATKSVIDFGFNEFEGIKVVPDDSSFTRQSLQGVPVWDYVKLREKTIEGTNEIFEGYEFPREMIVEAVFPKKVEETEIVGRGGTVEELMTLGDWQITLRGLIINYESKAYPEQQVRELNRICQLRDTELPVEGTYLNILGITHLSIHKFNPVTAVGYSHIQKFEIDCRSKIPFLVNPDYGTKV